MHELSIAQNIIEIVTDFANGESAEKVSEVVLEIGMVSGVIPETLEFVMDVATKGTVMENCLIKIIKVQAQAKCNSCQHEFPIDDIYSFCPVCSNIQFDIICGRELKVKSIRIE